MEAFSLGGFQKLCNGEVSQKDRSGTGVHGSGCGMLTECQIVWWAGSWCVQRKVVGHEAG